MEKYKRFQKEYDVNSDMDVKIQKFYNDLTTEGWKIIYYNEKEIKNKNMNNIISPRLMIIIVCCKNEPQWVKTVDI